MMLNNEEIIMPTVEEIEEMKRNEEPRPSLGKYGILFWDFMKEQHPGRYSFLMLETTMREIAEEVDREAREMMDAIQSQLRRQTPRPKPGSPANEVRWGGNGDFMATVQFETAIRDQAEEVVLRDIVYKRR